MTQHSHVFVVQAKLQGKPRTEEFMGRSFLAVPATMVRGQVLHNNLGATFLPPEEITDDWATQWNAVPVVVQDHPKVRGVEVSAREPKILSALGAGWVFHAATEDTKDGTRALKGEVWLDLDRVGQIPELDGIIERLTNGDPVELSTGFRAFIKNVRGEFKGEVYERTITPADPDHLAIFLEKVGACSVDDGCGLGVNQRTTTGDTATMTPRTTEASAAPSGNGSGDDRARVLRILDSFFNLFRVTTTPDGTDSGPGDPRGMVGARLYLRHLRTLGVTQDDLAAAFADIGNAASADRSDDEKRDMLWRAVRAAYGGPGIDVWLETVFSEAGEVVYCIAAPGYTEAAMYRAPFTLAEDGTVTFGEAKKVTRRVVYETVEAQQSNNSQAGEATMQQQNTPCAGAPASGTPTGTAAQTPPAPQPTSSATNTSPEAAAETGLIQRLESLETTVKAQADLIEKQASEIAGLRSAAAPAIAEQERVREGLLGELTSNTRVPFTREELAAKSTDELQKLAALAGGSTYTGRGAPRPAVNTSPAFAPPVPYYQKPAQGEKEKQQVS